MLALAFVSLVAAASPAERWYNYSSVNAVSGVHNGSVWRAPAKVGSEPACRTLAEEHGASIYTWHDAGATGGYALACILRTDAVWHPVAQAHHFSGIHAADRPPPAPVPGPSPPAPTPKPPPCHLNGAQNTTGTCTCDPGWVGPQCGQLDLLPAPPLAQQITAASALTDDNAAANATWGLSVIGPLHGVYHGYMTEIANHCMLAEYGIASQVIHMTARSPLGPWY